MPNRPTTPTLILAALAVAMPGLCAEVSSDTHPSLERALAEKPEGDSNQDGVLDLAEYTELAKNWKARKNAKEKPRSPYLPVRDNGDVVIADFEDNNLRVLQQRGWTIEGDAFHHELQTGTRMMKRRVGPFEGTYLLTTLIKSEGATGRLTSDEFTLELDQLAVVMSGGKFPHRIAVNLLVDGEVVRTATGRNDDYFETVAFAVGEFAGRMAQIEVVDDHRGLWGHINLERIFLTADAGEARVISERPGPSPSRGVVQTTNGPRRGPLEIRGGVLRVAGNAIADHELLLALDPRDSGKAGIRSAVRLVDGETWNADIRGLEAGKVSIRSALFGERVVALDKIASLEFDSAGSGAEREPGQLYRSDGEPIPGKLVWVREKDIAIDCALGIIPVPRESVQRFVLAAPARQASRRRDEIGLADGSLLFGRVSFAEDKVVIAHETLGELRLDWSAVRYLRRTPAGTAWLDQCKTTVVERIGPAMPPPGPAVLEASDADHLRTLRIMPRTVVRVSFPTGATGTVLRAQLAPIAGCRSPMVVRFRSGGTTIQEQPVAPDARPIPLSLDLPGSGVVTIEVDFAGPLAFPCAIDLRDAHVLALSTNSQPASPN